MLPAGDAELGAVGPLLQVRVDVPASHLGENEFALPQVTEGIMMRYWNEMYVARDAYALLKEDGRLDAPGDFPLRIEDYDGPGR